MTLTPDALRRMADAIEAKNCTGVSARWCPVHGDCLCPEWPGDLDADGCPLHDSASSHAVEEDDEPPACPCCIVSYGLDGGQIVHHRHDICQHVCCPDWDEE